jgi:hypothetical protein
VYSFDPLGVTVNGGPGHVLAGSSEQLADAIVTHRAFDIAEVRVDVVAPPGRRGEAVEATAEVVEFVHAG